MVSFFSLIEGKLYGGSLPKTSVDVDFLYEQGIRTIISLTTSGLARIDNRFQHIVIDIPDWGVPTEDQVHTFLKAVKASWKRDAPVYVHCYAGCGRTGTMLALAEVFLLGIEDGVEAIEKVRKARPCAVESRLQEDFVIELAEKQLSLDS
ncbi:MAG: protein-tyrosine phosphatase family protein [Candidatus Ranarchaeia archaeon]|jgi:atypical dual specificity phosphatase